MRARERAGFSIENRGARRSVARCSGKGSRVVAIGVDCRLMRAMAFIIAGVISCGAMSFRRRLVSACGARTSLEGADEVDACFLFADDDPIAAQCRDKQGCRRRGRRRPLFARAPLAPRIGLGPVQSSLVKPSLACPFPTLPLPLPSYSLLHNWGWPASCMEVCTAVRVGGRFAWLHQQRTCSSLPLVLSQPTSPWDTVEGVASTRTCRCTNDASSRDAHTLDRGSPLP